MCWNPRENFLYEFVPASPAVPTACLIRLKAFHSVGWGCKIRRLHLFRGIRTSLPITKPAVGPGWWFVMVKDGILVVEPFLTRQPSGQVTYNTPLWLVGSSPSTYMVSLDSILQFALVTKSQLFISYRCYKAVAEGQFLWQKRTLTTVKLHGI